MSTWPQCFDDSDGLIQHPQAIMSSNTSGLQAASFHQHIATPSHFDYDYDPDLNVTLIEEEQGLGSGGKNIYLWWKLALILWDLAGFLVNGLGIDMLWHGVEVNHAVYYVILQDICIAFITAVLSETLNWIFWSDDIMWYRYHGFLALVPLIFHSWAWASVAHLRFG